jgi:hypothetical protein
VHENIYLVNARNSQDAFKKAESYAKRECIDDPTLTVDGKPVITVFAGFRKLISVCHKGNSNALRSGDEVSYSIFHVSSVKAIKKLASGKRTSAISYME